MKRALHILLLVLTALTATAQRYPITITPVVTPPYTLNLGEMTSAGSTMLTATVTVNDITAANLPVRLHIKLTSPGITIESMPTATVSPMMLNGGESRILTGADLAPYLRLNNLSFNGYSKERYQQTGQIPGGVWKLTIEARHFYTNRLLSNSGGFTFWASVYDPPVLVSPANGVEAPSNPSLPMVLSWQASKHTGGTAPVQYTVNVWEMLAVGVPAPTVAMSSNPIYTATTTAQSHTLVTTGVPLKPSVRYCWQVTVSDPSRQAIINKGGKSEVREFTYMSTCPDVDEIRANVKGTQVDFTWDPTPRHDHFEVELLKEGGSSDVLTSYDDHFSYYDFERGTTWKARIKGYCPGGLSSDYSAWTSFSVPQAIQPPTDDECPDCGCEDVGSRTITNFEPGELQAGDTIKNRTGRTRFIVVSATPNGDGTYNGNFLLWMELWKVKFLCEYTNLKVNTDGVIVAGHWASVNNPALLGDPAQVAQFVSDLKNNVADYNNTIRDTISLTGGGYQTIYINSDGRYIAVKDDGTEVDVSGQLDEAHRTLVTDDEGHQMVVTADGTLMSAEQYRATGNNKTLISNSNTAKDRQAATGKVTFSKADGQKYGFDAYDATSNAYDAVYPALEGGYRPAYKSIARWQTDNVLATPLQGYTFRNQLGVPYAVKNGAVELRGDATAGESPVYAHVATSDTTTEVVGKLNLVTFDDKQVQLCLVPVNGARLPNATQLQAELNGIFAPAVASVTVTTHGGVTIGYANGKNFVHGGSGWLSVYNTDQKTAIDALTDAQDDVYYLFFVDNATKLDENDKPTIVAGYMPISRSFGFLYDSPTTKYIAHELAHGAFSLHHTFSDESESYHAASGTTPNLMDYSTGTTLNHLQWQWMHESHTNLLGFLDDESEGEAIVENVIVEWLNVKPQNLYNKKYLRFVKMGRMKENDPTQSLFFKMEDGSVIREYSVANQYYETDETERKFEIVLPNTKEPMPFYLDKHKDYLLSDDIAFIGKEVSRIAGTTIGRYVLPIEDMYIIFEGEDFDGNDASRLAAGGFLILDVVQAGKIYKLVKGVKSVQKTIIASEIATSQAKKRVVKSTFKNISKEAVVDMSCQFVIRLINECYEHPEYSNEDLFFSAMQQVEIGNAILGGAISTISFNNTEQSALACAQEFFESFEDGKEVNEETLLNGFKDCAIELGVTVVFKYGAKTDYMKGFFKQFNDKAKQNIIFSRLKKFTGENLYNSVEPLLKEMLKQ